MLKHTTKEKSVQEENSVVVRRTEFSLKKGERVRLTKQGNEFAEVMHLEQHPLPGIVKISKTHYRLVKTGEIKQYAEHNDKARNNLGTMFNDLRALIRTNFTQGEKNQVHITLTFNRRVRDRQVLYDEFNKFMKRLKYHYRDKHEFEYIVIMEPHGNGSWHCHLLLKSHATSLFIYKDVLQDIWGNGNCWVKQIKSDDVGTYYVAYFTDVLDVPEGTTDEEIEAMSSEEKSKKRIKGGRLSMYPVGFKFYRTSRGIKKPTVVNGVKYEKVLEEYGEPCFKQAFEVVDNLREPGQQVVNKVQKSVHRRSVNHGELEMKKAERPLAQNEKLTWENTEQLKLE